MKKEKLSSRIKSLSTNPGVYTMLNRKGQVIYVGKAKNLRKRVSQYFNKSTSGDRAQVLKKNIYDFSIILTKTETQALLLENDLIKQYKPKYNILLKDAKSYPYIYISNDKHPRLGLYRGKRNKDYQYFGPYTSAQIARNALSLLKKIFKVRQCSNSFYQSRSRPCLEYQIGLCSAPCVGKISDEIYNQDIEMVNLFLKGKDLKLLNQISQKMKQASRDLDFELAANYRDQMIGLRTIQEKHSSQYNSDMDVISAIEKNNVHCIEVIFVRSGKQIGSENFFPSNTKGKSTENVLSAFLTQYYLGKNTPREIVIDCKLSDSGLITKALSSKIIHSPRAEKKHFLEIASLNAKENLNQYLLSGRTRQKQLIGLKEVLALDKSPELMECFDVSHTMGEATTASCVVFQKGLPSKKEYRQFNIRDIKLGDDCAAIGQAVFRRYNSITKNNKKLPDIVFIDGGIGQLNQAAMVLDSIGIDSIKLVGITKGEGRKAGLETLLTVEDEKVKKIKLEPYNPVLLLINHIRDESHRFALKNHRRKRASKRNISPLERIEGIGSKKRKALLNYFGGLQEIEKASLEELKKVTGINTLLAIKIKEKLKIN